MALSGGISFKLDDKRLRKRFRKFQDKKMFQDFTTQIVQDIAMLAIQKAHVDTGEMRDSIYYIPATGGWKVIGEVGAVSDHSIYEEARGGDHAFLTNALAEYEQRELGMKLQDFVEMMIEGG